MFNNFDICSASIYYFAKNIFRRLIDNVQTKLVKNAYSQTVSENSEMC